jgi:hypothetical protein
MAAIDQGMISNFLNATLPTGGTAGAPTAWVTLSTSAMYMRWDSTAPSASAAGTQLANGNAGSSPSVTNYASPGISFTVSSTASSSGSNVTLPAAVTSTVAPAGGYAAIYGLDIYSSGAVRTWFGTFNGAPIVVAFLNTFQLAINAVTVSLT